MGDQGFSKLNEEYTRSSVFHITPPAEGYGLQGGTRINLGFGRCLKLRVKAERDEGSLRIGGLALAANCNHIVLIFGFFFLLAGAVLTTLAYKTKPQETSESLDVGPREDGKVAGPLFVVIGSTLVIVGMGLTLVGWKVNQEAKRQRNHFTLQTPPPPTPDSQDYFGSGFANIHDSSFLSRVTTPSTFSSRRESFFSGSVFSDRRRTLPTIAQAVPIGFFVDGRLSGVPEGASISSRQPTSPGSSNRVGNLKQMETDGNMDSNETNVHRKASLSLRPSLPIPIIASPSFIRSRMISPLDPSCLVRTRSDEPFGSIVSLSGTGDIACFPGPPTLFAPCPEEELPSLEIPENSASRTITTVHEATTSSTSTIDYRKLPDIQVNNEHPTFVSNQL